MYALLLITRLIMMVITSNKFLQMNLIKITVFWNFSV